ncbi:hypothetical protein IT407_04375 [Candidatus Uhrbacteria bacterium]|nr:hypothetical protein [Candidatus Uhrbacteria bacterium]
MKNILSLLVLSFLFVGCGASRASTSDSTLETLLAERDAARTEAATARSELERYLTDPDASVGTSGGSVPVVAPVSGTVAGGTPIMSCDGVDSSGMILTGMTTETMGFSSGDRPWEITGSSTGGMRHRIDYSGEFPIAIAVNGRVMHHFVGGMPTSATMRMADGNYCLMPAIPATVPDQMSPRSYMSVDFVFDNMVPSQTLTVMCLSGGSGRASMPFASWNVSIPMSSTSGYTRITGDMCRRHMRGA